MNGLFIGVSIVCFIVSYLLGSISFGYIVGKESGVDIRSERSGNIGTTSALRTLGIKAGLLTFLGDFLKAFIPVFLVYMFSENLFGFDQNMTYIVSIISGIGAVMGHNFPAWMGFKGGKGIAVTAGVTVAVSFFRPYYWICALLIFIIIVLISKYVSLGSLCVPAWAIPVYTILFERDNTYFALAVIISLIYTVLAFIKHSSNIKRLLNGTENKLFGKKKNNSKEDC